jgi:hypothetical protein
MGDTHLVVKDLRLARFSFGNQGVIKHIKHILTDTLKLCFNFLTVLADDHDVFLRALGVLLLFNRGNDAPGGTTGSNNIFVGYREEIALVDRKFTSKLIAGQHLPPYEQECHENE